MQNLWSYVSKSILLGIAVAAVLLLALPQLQNKQGLALSQPFSLGLNEQMSFSAAVKRAAPSVVNIYTRTYQKSTINSKATLRPQSLGSGVIMNKKGYLLTNYHVIADADQIIVALQDGRFFTAELIGFDRYTDLAVLNIDAKNLPSIPQSKHEQTNIGDVVLAIGNPYNLGQTITQGIISARGRIGMSTTGHQNFLQTDAAINEGNSGGALVNSLGELVGINTASFQVAENVETMGISFAIPYPLAVKIMDALIANGRVIRGYLGIEGTSINTVMAKLLGLKANQGIVVQNTAPDSPAEKAGLISGDVVIKFNDTEIDNVIWLMDSVAEQRPGAKINLTVIRDGKQFDISVTLGELQALQPQP
ncbi:outer membrane-stress sensor serine endopeptidase DegS [Moritella sp. F3]|uniref:outer membrane-stress sensor serine endopeptidase DegS n=1 Tax=Moritella sp. F3 TaxID=2718882 RepID=UPI0018E1A1D0|nr:outer membrane-stress sensor serine endopeptidase DegS [Moritella sp. F3]GIC76116.1 outer membrane-stress sensor serine endopeptidase DegS [Moritella sp. F1]GIC82781.1 outer membrane-stress sensor serine endopeptidase DegS [Moritella sp. F3]